MPHRPFQLAPSLALSIALVFAQAGIAGPAFAQEHPLGSNVQGLLEYARSHSPEIGAMRLEANAAAQRVDPAGALPDPVLRVEPMNLNSTDASPEIKYTLMQTLPFFGKRGLRREAAAAEARQAESRTAAAWLDLATRIKSAYAEYNRAAGNERLTREILELMAQLEQVAQARYAGGLVPQQDPIRAQLEQTAMRSELISLESEKRQLRHRLNALLGRESAAALAEPGQQRPLPAVTAADAMALADRARAANPKLQAEQTRLASARLTHDLTLRNRYPDLQVGVAPTQMGSRITSWGLMFEVSIPLQQGTRRSQEAEALAMVGAAEAKALAIANELVGELAGNLAALDAARRAEALMRTQLLPQSQLSLRSAQAAYESGKADFAAVVEAQRQIRKARQDLLKAQTEAQLRLADIERILGEDL